MAEAKDPLIQECTMCGSLIDVSDEEPLALMHCPTCGAAMRVRTQFGNFQLLAILGAGGMGAVYRAQDLTLNRTFALKLLRREYLEHPEFVQQFEHEAAITALINHPNVVKVYSSGCDKGLLYIAMELVDKGSLDELMTLQKKVSEPQVLELGIQIAQGLRAAFQRGLIHRDVKPGNILFAEAHHAKIVDFGLAAPIDKAGGVNGEVWGTPYYVAPEKLEQPVREDFRSDMYSLGATLYHAIAGRPPHEAQDASLSALKALKSAPVSLQRVAPHVSSSTAYVLNRTLAHNPAERYASYDELIEHLEYARGQLLTKGGRRVPLRAGQRPGQRPPPTRVVLENSGQQTVMSILTVLTLLVMGAGGWYIWHERQTLFPEKKPPRDPALVKAQKAATELKPRYEEARALLLEGKYEAAAQAFHQILQGPANPQPTLDWTSLHAGLALLMAGKLDESRADFEKLSQYGPFSEDPFDKEFADFMTTVGKRMMDENPIPADQVSSCKKDDYQAIGLLLYGLKNWELGEIEVAQTFFRQFESSSPGEPDDWIAQYKRIPVSYAESYEKYAKFAEHAKMASDPEKAKLEIPKLKTELDDLHLGGPLLKKGKTAIRKVQQLVDDHEAELKAAETEMEASDAQSIAAAKTKGDALAAQFNFKAALVEAKGVQVVTEKGKADKKGLIKRYDWLISFKSNLSQDLVTIGYPAGLARKSGPPIPGTVSDADEANLVVKIPNGSTTIPWTAASFEGLFAMARAFLRPSLPPDRLADREWFLGVFCDFNGRTNEASALFKQAVKNRPDYADEWKYFPNVPK